MNFKFILQLYIFNDENYIDKIEADFKYTYNNQLANIKSTTIIHNINLYNNL